MTREAALPIALLLAVLSSSWMPVSGSDVDEGIVPHPLLAGGGTVAAAEGDPAAPDCLAAPPIVFVDVCATGRNTGMNWTDAFADLQDALNLAACSVAVREIWVAAGTYRPSRRVHPTDVQSATFQLLSGLAIYGGFDGSETEREERNPERNTTILSGDLEERDNSGRVRLQPCAIGALGSGGSWPVVR